MITNILNRYARYNYWANKLIFSLVGKKVNNDLLDKHLESSFPSLRKTVYHIWDAEYIWLKRLKGESLRSWPSQSFNGTFSEALIDILEIDEEFISFISKSDDEKLLSPYNYKNIEGKSFSNPVWESVHHCFNHSTYHRGQTVTMLRQLGISEIPSTDFIVFCRLD